MLEVCDVTKRYGALTAVSHLSFTVKPGEVLGYLGPNGSGKSTTVKMLAGLMPPSRGRILFDGEDIQDDLVAYKAQVGYVPEEAHVYTYLTGPEYLRLCGRLRGIAAGPLETTRSTGSCASSASTPTITRRCRRFRRACGRRSCSRPRSSTTRGSSSSTSRSRASTSRRRSSLRTIVRALADDGRIIFYSSHELDTVERISTRVMILRAGQVVADDSAARLRELMHAPSLEDVFAQLAVHEDVDRVAGELLDTVRL